MANGPAVRHSEAGLCPLCGVGRFEPSLSACGGAARDGVTATVVDAPLCQVSFGGMNTARVTTLLASTIFLSGASFAAMTPYRAIVGVETLGLSNSQFGLIMALNAIGGLSIAVLLGWLSDKVRDRRVLALLCAIGGALGFLLVWTVKTPIGFATAFCLLIPFGNALFSQSFSLSRAFYDRETPKRSELMMSYLRTGFTLAWIAVPPVAGWLAATSSSYAVFAISALAHVGCSICIALLWTDPRSKIGTGGDAGGDKTTTRPSLPVGRRFGILGVTLSSTALQLNISILPLVIINDLGGSLGQVGILSGVAAAIEVPVMIGWGYLALRWRKESVLGSACMVFAAYFASVIFATDFIQVLVLQILAAIAIAAVLSINISYLQEAIPGRIGLSTSLVDVTNVVAALIAAAIFAANPWSNYAPMMGFAALISIAGALSFVVARRLTP